MAYGATNAILMTDRKLYHFRVLGESDEDGDWEYEGALQEEITTREYLDRAPSLIKGIERLILELK